MSDEREHDLFPPALPPTSGIDAEASSCERARELSLPVDSRPVTGEACQQATAAFFEVREHQGTLWGQQ